MSAYSSPVAPARTPMWIIVSVAVLAGGVGSAAVFSAGEFLRGARSESPIAATVATVLAGPDRPMPMGLVKPSAAPVVADFDVQALAAGDPRFGGVAGHGAEAAFALVDKTAKAKAANDEPVTLAALAEEKRKPTKAVEAAAANAKPRAAGPITGRATTNDAVNIRSGPNTKSPTIGVVPQNSAIDIVKCASWCEIVYNGTHGFIYSGFVGSKGVSGKAPATAVAKNDPAGGKVKSSVTIAPKRSWWPFGSSGGSNDQANTPVPAFN